MTTPATEPRLGLVLGGGGARGLAHIGVLRVLERENIPIACVAGTSMGGLVGALYAAGVPADRVEEEVIRLSSVTVSRPMLSATGLVTFNRMERWLEDTIGEYDVRDLAIPFAAVASDLVSGERVVLWRGRLCTAIRASCSVPGFASPIELDGRMLVDGGITDNVPADVARMLGADYVIGVDIFMPALRRRLGPLGQGLAAIETLVRHAGQGDAECDCLIVPHMEGRSYFRFSHYEQFIALGEAAAREKLPTILAALERAKRARAPPASAPAALEFDHILATA